MSPSINGVHRLTMPTAASVPRKQMRACARARACKCAFHLQDQPARAQQAIAEQQRHAGEQRERREAVEGCRR